MATSWAEVHFRTLTGCSELLRHDNERKLPGRKMGRKKTLLSTPFQVQGVEKDQVEGWHLKKASEGCSKHNVVAQAREMMPSFGWVWMSVLQEGRAVRTGGLLTVLGNYCPLAWSRAEVPGYMEDLVTGCQALRIWSRKMSQECPYKCQQQGRQRSWKRRCVSIVPWVFRPPQQPLSSGNAFPQSSLEGHPWERRTEWQGKPPPQFT